MTLAPLKDVFNAIQASLLKLHTMASRGFQAGSPLPHAWSQWLSLAMKKEFISLYSSSWLWSQNHTDNILRSIAFLGGAWPLEWQSWQLPFVTAFEEQAILRSSPSTRLGWVWLGWVWSCPLYSPSFIPAWIWPLLSLLSSFKASIGCNHTTESILDCLKTSSVKEISSLIFSLSFRKFLEQGKKGATFLTQ